MDLDALLASASFLGSVWGGLATPKTCPSNPEALPRPVLEAPKISAAVTAFIDVNVLPMDSEQVFANQTVLVENGKITVLGPASQVKVPAGAVRVDGRGKYLMPGLTDMHFHLWGSLSGNDGRGMVRVAQDSLFRHLAGGVTAVRFIGGWYQDRQWYRDSWRSEIPTPRIYWPPQIPANPSIRPDTVAGWVTAVKAAGYDFIAMPYYLNGATRPPSSDELIAIDSILVAARRTGLPVAIHDTPYPFDRLLALGKAGGSFEHLTPEAILDTFGVVGFAQPDVPLATMQRVASALQRAGVWVTPTLQCDSNGQLLSNSNLSKMFHHFTKALQDAGVKLLLSGDDGWTVHDELAALVRAGLTPYQALVTGTRNPAEYFGKLNEVGTVAVGKRADLVLLNSNPFTDIRHTREPAGVMLAGRWLDRTELDRRLLAWRSSGLHTDDLSRPEPHPWLVAALNNAIVGGRTNGKMLSAQLHRLGGLADSLAMMSTSNGRAYEPLGLRLAAVLGELRAPLTPTQQERFDPIARVWLREQIRRGYRIAVPGVAVTR